MSRIRRVLVCLIAIAGTRGGAAFAASDQDLTTLSLEQLMNEPVTSVSKKPTRIGDSAAAITVITQEDLRRMGVTTLPEALRMVPGMDVARIGASQWAVSPRGFNDEFANKLLVLVDGRTIYTPSSGGIFWNAQDVIIEDINRIEVIRGPGATLWGANAVNGVINVITKSSRDTQGTSLAVTTGNEENLTTTARYGSEATPDLSWRVFAKYLDRSGFEDTTHTLYQGHWDATHVGFRTDWSASSKDDVMVQADGFVGYTAEQADVVSLTPPSVTTANLQHADNGLDVVGQWTHAFSDDSALMVQGYLDHERQGVGYDGERRDSYDLDFQHTVQLGSRNAFLWGAGFRDVSIQQLPRTNIFWSPDTLNIQFLNIFLQDELTLVPDKLTVTVGSKFERDHVAGWFIDPGVWLAWTPTGQQTVWASVSRASRTPAEFELSAILNLSASQAPGGLPQLLAILPDPSLQAEQMLSYELGYRLQPVPSVSLDVTAFVNQYSQLVDLQFVGSTLVSNPAPPHELIGWMHQNGGHANTSGFEAAVQRG